MKYGDILRYPKKDDPGADWLFMFIVAESHLGYDYHRVQCIKVHWQDDQWEPGTIILAGVNELVPIDA
jgi:hypothetical protein